MPCQQRNMTWKNFVDRNPAARQTYLIWFLDKIHFRKRSQIVLTSKLILSSKIIFAVNKQHFLKTPNPCVHSTPRPSEMKTKFARQL